MVILQLKKITSFRLLFNIFMGIALHSQAHAVVSPLELLTRQIAHLEARLKMMEEKISIMEEVIEDLKEKTSIIKTSPHTQETQSPPSHSLTPGPNRKEMSAPEKGFFSAPPFQTADGWQTGPMSSEFLQSLKKKNKNDPVKNSTDVLKEAKKLAFSKNFRKAEELLKPILKNAKDACYADACYTMGMILLIQGGPQKHKYSLDQASSYFSETYTHALKTQRFLALKSLSKLYTCLCQLGRQKEANLVKSECLSQIEKDQTLSKGQREKISTQFLSLPPVP